MSEAIIKVENMNKWFDDNIGVMIGAFLLNSYS